MSQTKAIAAFFLGCPAAAFVLSANISPLGTPVVPVISQLTPVYAQVTQMGVSEFKFISHQEFNTINRRRRAVERQLDEALEELNQAVEDIYTPAPEPAVPSAGRMTFTDNQTGETREFDYFAECGVRNNDTRNCDLTIIDIGGRGEHATFNVILQRNVAFMRESAFTTSNSIDCVTFTNKWVTNKFCDVKETGFRF